MPAAWLPGVNASGQMGFSAAFGSWDEEAARYESYGVYRRTPTTTELLAFTGDPLPDGSGRTFDRVSFVAIESSGDVIFLGESCDGSPLNSLECFYGIYRATGSSLVTLVHSGQSVPDSATDTVGTIFFRAVAAADGHIAFVTTRKPSGLAVVYKWSAGALTPIASEGQPAPETGRTFTEFRDIVVNSSGTAAFIGQIGASYSESGAFASEHGVLRTLAYTGSPAASGGSFDLFRTLAMDEAGSVAFESWTTIYAGIYVDSGGSLRTVGINGQAIVGTGAVLDLAASPSIHDGRVAFYGNTISWPAQGPPPEQTTAVFAEVDGTIVRVAFQGQPTPDGVPGIFLDIGGARFTANGEILFVAAYGDAGDTPWSGSASGLFRARFAPEVPALGAPAQLLAAALLALSGARAVRRASGRSARSAPRRARAACEGAGRREGA